MAAYCWFKEVPVTPSTVLSCCYRPVSSRTAAHMPLELWMKEKVICNIWALLDSNCTGNFLFFQGVFKMCSGLTSHSTLYKSFWGYIFQFVQQQYLTFVNKVIIMQLKSSQGSVATVCRWSGQVNNRCAATYLSMLCAKYYKNQLIFLTTAK